MEKAVVIIKKELFRKTTSYRYKLGSNITYKCRGHCGPKEDGQYVLEFFATEISSQERFYEQLEL